MISTGTAKWYLAERGIDTGEMVEGSYGSAYHLESIMESYAKEYFHRKLKAGVELITREQAYQEIIDEINKI